jgi:hypothetical protein
VLSVAFAKLCDFARRLLSRLPQHKVECSRLRSVAPFQIIDLDGLDPQATISQIRYPLFESG